MHIVKIHEAKSTLSKLVKMTLAGERVVIANGNEPVVELIVTTLGKPQKRLGIGAWRGLFEMPDVLAPMTEEELADWEGPLEPSS